MAKKIRNSEIFNPPPEALEEWAGFLKTYGNAIPDEVVRDSLMYKANKKWAESVKKAGHSILDLGGDTKKSAAYKMEREVFYGND